MNEQAKLFQLGWKKRSKALGDHAFAKMQTAAL